MKHKILAALLLGSVNLTATLSAGGDNEDQKVTHTAQKRKTSQSQQNNEDLSSPFGQGIARIIDFVKTSFEAPMKKWSDQAILFHLNYRYEGLKPGIDLSIETLFPGKNRREIYQTLLNETILMLKENEAQLAVGQNFSEAEMIGHCNGSLFTKSLQPVLESAHIDSPGVGYFSERLRNHFLSNPNLTDEEYNERIPHLHQFIVDATIHHTLNVLSGRTHPGAAHPKGKFWGEKVAHGRVIDSSKYQGAREGLKPQALTPASEKSSQNTTQTRKVQVNPGKMEEAEDFYLNLFNAAQELVSKLDGINTALKNNQRALSIEDREIVEKAQETLQTLEALKAPSDAHKEIKQKLEKLLNEKKIIQGLKKNIQEKQ